MNKREMKRALKLYIARKIWYDIESQDEFAALHDITTEAALERMERVILEVLREARN